MGWGGMSSDIVERCEYEARSVESVFPSIADALRLAAAEIERLRDWHSEMFHYAADRDAEIERLRAAGDAMVQLICLNPNTPSQEDWDAAIAAWQEARREQ